jgi:hypothetical protein
MVSSSYFSCVLAFVVLLLTALALADDGSQIKRIVSAISRALPDGWSVVEEKEAEIPWGHHWCNSYDGPKGTLLVIKGVRPTSSEFLGKDGEWRATPVGTESLQIWIMPGSYHDSYLAWFCHHRPIQPTEVIRHSRVKVYASPSSILMSQKYFNDLLSKSQGVRSPDSPANSPETLTWKDWQKQLSTIIIRDFLQ